MQRPDTHFASVLRSLSNIPRQVEYVRQPPADTGQVSGAMDAVHVGWPYPGPVWTSRLERSIGCIRLLSYAVACNLMIVMMMMSRAWIVADCLAILRHAKSGQLQTAWLA